MSVLITGLCRTGTTLLYDILRHDPKFQEHYCDFLYPNLAALLDMPIHAGNATLKSHIHTWLKPDLLWNPIKLEKGDVNQDLSTYLHPFLTHPRAVCKITQAILKTAWIKEQYPRVPIVATVRDPKDILFSACGRVKSPNQVKKIYYDYDTFTAKTLKTWPSVCEQTAPFFHKWFLSLLFHYKGFLEQLGSVDWVFQYSDFTCIGTCLAEMNNFYQEALHREMPQEVIDRIVGTSRLSDAYRDLWDPAVHSLSPADLLQPNESFRGNLAWQELFQELETAHPALVQEIYTPFRFRQCRLDG